jgi:hypothetical protein
LYTKHNRQRLLASAVHHAITLRRYELIAAGIRGLISPGELKTLLNRAKEANRAAKHHCKARAGRRRHFEPLSTAFFTGA